MAKLIPLNETVFTKGHLVETDGRKLPKGVLCKVAYPICNIGEKNQNNRVYTKEVWDRVLADEDLQRKMKERTLFGQAEHPAETQSDLQLTSHVITRTWIDEGTDKVMQEMDVLNTPCGKIIDTLLEAGCLVGVSTRAEGELEEMNEGEGDTYFNVIPDSYVYVATDFTADPSTFDVTPAKYERSVVKDIRTGLQAKKLDKHFAMVLLESMESKEAKKVLETIKIPEKKEGKNKALVLGNKVKVTTGEHKDKIGTVDKIEESRVMLTLEDGTTISTDIMGVIQFGEVEVVPAPEKVGMDLEPEPEIPPIETPEEEPIEPAPEEEELPFESKRTDEAKVEENKLGVDSVKDVKAGIKQASTALKDKDYDAAAQALDDVADDAAHGAKSVRKMKRADGAKADDNKKKADEAAEEQDKAIVDAVVDEEIVDEITYSVKYKDKGGEKKEHTVKASDAIKASEKAQETLGEEARIISIDVTEVEVVPEAKVDEVHKWNIGDEISWHGRAGKVVGESADGNSYKVHFLDSDKIEWVDVVEANVTEEEEVAEKIVQVGDKWQVQSESGKNLGTYATEAEAHKRLGQVEYFKKNESIIINDTIRELRIKEASMKAEREKAIELLEELEQKTKSDDKAKTLEIRVLINKLRDIQIRESDEVAGLRRLIEERSKSLQIAFTTVEGLQKKYKKEMTELKQQVKEQELKIKKIAEEYVTKLCDKTKEIEESYKKEFIKRYTNFKIESSGLNVHESSRALLEKKSTVEEVDAIFEEIRDAMRRGALHAGSLIEIEVPDEEPVDPLRKKIGETIRGIGF